MCWRHLSTGMVMPQAPVSSLGKQRRRVSSSKERLGNRLARRLHFKFPLDELCTTVKDALDDRVKFIAFNNITSQFCILVNG